MAQHAHSIKTEQERNMSGKDGATLTVKKHTHNHMYQQSYSVHVSVVGLYATLHIARFQTDCHVVAKS